MISGPGAAAVVRTVFTAMVVLLAIVLTGFCAYIGLWVFAYAGGPGMDSDEVFKAAAGLIVIVLIAIAAVIAQLRWANHGSDAGAIALRSLLALAGPAAVILFAALAAD